MKTCMHCRHATGPCDAPQALIANIPDSQLSGLSYRDNDDQYHYKWSRLHSQGGAGGWVAETRSSDEYIQADFGQLMRIQGIATQARHHDVSYYVTRYWILYSTDGITFDRVRNDNYGTFMGNSDMTSVVENSFTVLVARFIRLQTLRVFNYPSTRWEVYGCSYTP